MVSALTLGAHSTEVTINASGFGTDVGVEGIFDISCEAIGLTDDEVDLIKHICAAKDFSEVLRSEWADTNMAVAKLICLDLGWHLEYQ